MNYKLKSPQEILYNETAISDEYVLGICEETWARILNLAIVSISQGQMV